MLCLIHALQADLRYEPTSDEPGEPTTPPPGMGPPPGGVPGAARDGETAGRQDGGTAESAGPWYSMLWDAVVGEEDNAFLTWA